MKCAVPMCKKYGPGPWYIALHRESGAKDFLCKKHYREFTRDGLWVAG